MVDIDTRHVQRHAFGSLSTCVRHNDEMFSSPDANQSGTKLSHSVVDAFAEFWAGGEGPKHSVITRKIAAAGITPTEGVSKEQKIVDAFMAANEGQAYKLMSGLLEALRTFSSSPYARGQLADSEEGLRLRRAIESAGFALSKDFELIENRDEDAAPTPSKPTPESLSWDWDRVSESQPASGSDISAEEMKSIKRSETGKTPPKEIFLVHGHDETAMLQVSDWVHDLTGVKPVVLSKQINRGSTLIEKFESYAKDAACAIVLMTPDDEARPKRGPRNAIAERARQNVVFELGYFYGKLKRENVIVLNFGVELPGDINGLVYIDRDNWKLELGRELADLGYSTHLARS